MEPGELLAQGMEFARKGDRKRARERIAKAVKADPSLKQGWWALAHLLDDKDQQLHCLMQVLKLDPADEQAHARLEQLTGASQPSATQPPSDSQAPSRLPRSVHSPQQQPTSPEPSRGRNPFIVAGIGVVGVILIGVFLTLLLTGTILPGILGVVYIEEAIRPVPMLPLEWTPAPEIMVLVPTGSPTATVTEVRPQNSPTITKTPSPSLTPAPLYTATITPTFNPRLVATMTPSSPESCPDASLLGPLNLTHPQEDWYAPAEEILQYLNAGGSLDEVKRALNEINNFHTELQVVDLTNDGVSEIVLHSFAVYVFRCSQGEYHEMLQIQPEILDMYGGSMTVLARDLNHNGVQDLLLTSRYEGMNDYSLNVLVYEWDGETFASLIPEEVHHPYYSFGYIVFEKGLLISTYNGSMELQDVDHNGTIEIILKGGRTGGYISMLSAPQRSEIQTWMWNGEEFNFYDVAFSMPSLKIHVVQEGDVASRLFKYEQALELYWRAIEDPMLEAWNVERNMWSPLGIGPGTPQPTYPPPDQDQAKRVEAYARFRIVVTNLLLERTTEAATQYQLIQELHHAGDPGHHFALLATAFYDAYQDTGSIGMGCEAARSFTEQNQAEILGSLGWAVYGEATSGHDVEDICPFQ
jgi:tetratricopeptide (TPR) repeat protein